MSTCTRVSYYDQQKVFVVNVKDTTPTNEIEGNSNLKSIRFKLIRPEGSKLNSNFREFCIIVKEASLSDLNTEEIEDVFSNENNTDLRYICVHKSYGTILGFVRNERMYNLRIPNGIEVDCLMEVYASEEDPSEISCYVDATNRRIFTDDYLSRFR